MSRVGSGLAGDLAFLENEGTRREFGRYRAWSASDVLVAKS